MKLALLIEYDGTDFAGWQTQRMSDHADDRSRGRSVQKEIEKGFRQLFGNEITVHGAGRTDSGVHARGMVAHIEFPTNSFPLLFKEGPGGGIPKLIMAINATTPRDIAILDIRSVPDDFHARHSAIMREYRYTITRDRTAIDRNYVWAVRGTFDLEVLHACAAFLPGEHDFTSFSKRTTDVKHYRCIVERAEWSMEGKYLHFTIRANRFVRGMVRALLGAMMGTAQGKLSLADFESLLHCPQETWRAKYIAPAHGLSLERVEYPERFSLWNIPNSSRK